MQDFQTFNPTNYTQLLSGVVFYGLILLALFMSTASIYVLIKRGQHRGLALIVSVVYIIFFVTLVAEGTRLLTSIQ